MKISVLLPVALLSILAAASSAPSQDERGDRGNEQRSNALIQVLETITQVQETITCAPSTAPSNGSVSYSSIADDNDSYAFEVVATYNCFTGFSLVGDNSRTCTGDGSSTTGAFDGISPICEAITCPPLSKPTNGSVSYSNVPGQSNTYAFNVMATYSCDTGFSLVDNNTRTCTGDGSSTTGAFDGEAPHCEVVMASSLSLIRDVVIPVVSVVAVLALVILVGAVYGYIKVFAHLMKLRNPQTGTAKPFSI